MTDFQSQIQILTRSMLTLERLWELAGFQPNERQREAILHVDGPLYLTAGPGSGKTRVLLWRALNLIVFHEVEPGEIFLSTFTEKAALQLREGLQALLGYVTNFTGQPFDLTPMYVGTVHSLCQRMLTDRRFSADRERTRPPHLLDDLGQYFHLYRTRNWRDLLSSVDLTDDLSDHELINAIFVDRYRSKHSVVRNCMAFFNRLSEEHIDPLQALARIAQSDGQFAAYAQRHEFSDADLDLLIKLYTHYKASLVDRNGIPLTDFALLQQQADEVLDSFDRSGHVFKHVIVDEYQDTNTIQERLFFKLAAGHQNICVVGDDDQALYRFRGATVENFVQFPQRCVQYLDREPRRIPLSINYRSRTDIVRFYTDFMSRCDWSAGNGEFYRVADKRITAHRSDDQVAVVGSRAAHPDDVATEIAQLVRQLIDKGKVEDPNQIAFLFPSLKSKQTQRMKEALEAPDIDLKVYAPRAGSFLQVEESVDMFGLFVHVFGLPPRGRQWGGDYGDFVKWLDSAKARAEGLMDRDSSLAQYVNECQIEMSQLADDYEALIRVVTQRRWDLDGPYDIDLMKRALYNAGGLSDKARRSLGNRFFDDLARTRANEGRPFTLGYVVNRATALDWNVLDLFYRFCGFEHFKQMFDLAERGEDEGPICNLGLISQYLARFVDERASVITAKLLGDHLFQKVFFMSYLFALFRLGESEYEDAEDPFPKGRIPFLTIHQSKGLEFPVVVLANPRKDSRQPQRVEVLVRPLLTREPGEPLDRMPEFDTMRMFYVALSRAKNLVVLAHFQGRGQRINEPFKTMLDDDFPRIPALDLDAMPETTTREEQLPRSYSFTADYLNYTQCPRQYMVFRKYGFAASRSQTMFFGSLVHRTLEDLHNHLIAQKEGAHG